MSWLFKGACWEILLHYEVIPADLLFSGCILTYWCAESREFPSIMHHFGVSSEKKKQGLGLGLSCDTAFLWTCFPEPHGLACYRVMLL